ncbi:sensor histidine kinase [Ruminiclostridium cellulolyticum]|uniref:Signal transduction histidine kinase regulating citrate/malate metabolism n=1 Tax=Ruminiclostridium cellulolyticum (strain ATCC 35319 / DSM 5812 / JCM 6584 / H10) TaxID=394503 RepID=B8I436_RUMCH|nr:GHKL domain-containing protein [Ruminiclostridium cellulolyticum]ACL76469.1 signal transduction histidine kinase regulating citrate/malate metabolism [Ruminiclostridium cellulolyticum H10]
MFIIGQLLINTVFAMITAYLIYIFLKNNFDIKIQLNFLVAFIVCNGFLNGVLSTMWMSVLPIPGNLQFLKTIILTILNIILIKYLLRVEWLKAVLSFCLIILFVGVGNFTVPLIFYSVGINATPEIINNDLVLFFIMNLIIYCIALVLIKLTPYVKSIGNIKNLTPVGFLLVITILIMASFLGMHFVVHFDPVSFIIVLIASLAYFFFSVWYINIYHKYEMKKEEQKQQEFYNESLANTLHDLRRIKHDQMNHLTVLYAMHQMNKYDAAASYLKEIIGTNQSLGNTAIYNIKNAGLFGLISSKINYANSHGIRFDLETIGEVDSVPYIKISDLCEVIAIYIDNALEEVLNNGKLKLDMKIISTEESLTIRIENECIKVPDIKNSSKGADRGNGLIIANKIIASYKNILSSTTFDENRMVFLQVLRIIAKEA